MNKETQQINITPEMLQEIIIIQQASLFSFQREVDNAEAVIAFGDGAKQKGDLWSKVDSIRLEFEDKYGVELLSILHLLVNIKELHTYLYEE